jgi:hypothetical protein
MHLTDPGFANQVGESSDGTEGARKSGLSAEEIAKVKQEWEDQQKLKMEREEAKKKDKDEKEKSNKDKEEGKNSESKDSSKKSSNVPGACTPPSTTSATPTPTHQRFTLHRDIFALRLSDHRKRRQAAQAKLLAPRLPGAPQGGLA